MATLIFIFCHATRHPAVTVFDILCVDKIVDKYHRKNEINYALYGTENYPKKQVSLLNKSRHCAFLIYRVKTGFKKKNMLSIANLRIQQK